METEYMNNVTSLNEHENDTAETTLFNVRILATSYLMYKIGDVLNKYYFLLLVPAGVIGNVLSFLVMIQRHNRHNSFSLYIAALAITDTLSLITSPYLRLGSFTLGDDAFFRYLNLIHHIELASSQYLHCQMSITVWNMTSTTSTLIILFMTFERFYSIIQPHKTASFNTVKRAKITLLCCSIFGILYDIPHWFTTSVDRQRCVPLGKARDSVPGWVYYWVNFLITFAVPFILLLMMNCVIIQKLRKRSDLKDVRSQGQGHCKGQGSSDMQIYVLLLVVTFSFLMLTSPTHVFLLFVQFFDYTKTAKSFALYYFLFNIAHKAYNTNYGINFYLYVISGHKFKTDLLNLLCKRSQATQQ